MPFWIRRPSDVATAPDIDGAYNRGRADERAARKGKVWARFNVPALVDGEPVKLGRDAEFKFNPHAFRALGPEPEPEVEI